MARRNNNSKGNSNYNRASKGTTVTEAPKGSTFGIKVSGEKTCEDFGKINYSYLPGTPILRNFQMRIDLEDKNPMSAIPGVMSIPFVPTIGYQTGSSMDPINLAAAEIYTKVRQANSGAKNYDQNNLMIHIMGMDSLYSFHAWMIRTYTIIQMYTKKNFYLPEVLALANNLDIEDLQANITQFLGYINLFAKRATKLSIPDVVPLITDHARMCNWVYADDNSILGQFYNFVPAGFYKYEENVSSGTKFGSLVWTKLEPAEDALITMDYIRTYGNQLLEDMLNSADMSTINGDIQKAYGESTLLTMPTISEDIQLDIHYDEQVMLAIHNADFLSDTKIIVGDITANPTDNNLSQSITLNLAKSDANDVDFMKTNNKVFIDQFTDEPTIEDNYTAIRFKAGIASDTTTSPCKLLFYGTEILLTPDIWSYYYSENDGSYSALSNKFYQTLGIDTSATNPKNLTMRQTLSNFERITPFDKAPLVYYGSIGVANAVKVIKAPRIIGRMHNPTLVDVYTIQNMCIAYMMAAFAV